MSISSVAYISFNIFLSVLYFARSKVINNTFIPPELKVPGAFNNKSRDTIGYFYSATGIERRKLEDILKIFLQPPSLSPWEPVVEISEERPYLFFHARKAAGSTFRSNLYDAAKTLGMSSYIACEDGIDCDSYIIPHNISRAIYGMHMHWGAQFELETLRQRNRHPISTNEKLFPLSDSSDPGFSCMTNVREPVSRLISCIKYRFLREEHGGKFSNVTCIGDLPAHELYHLLAEETDDFSNSCLNEPFRVFSGLYDEDTINSLGIELDTTRHLAVPKLTHLSLDVLEETLMRHQLCTPYILEVTDESSDLLAYRFPDLYWAGAFRTDMASNIDHTSEHCPGTRSKPNYQQLRLLEHFAAYERLLYDALIQKVKVAHAELMANATAVAAVQYTKAKQKQVMQEQFLQQPAWLQAKQQQAREEIAIRKQKLGLKSLSAMSSIRE